MKIIQFKDNHLFKFKIVKKYLKNLFFRKDKKELTTNLNLIVLSLIAFDIEINDISISNKKKVFLRDYLKLSEFSVTENSKIIKLKSLFKNSEIRKKMINEIDEYLFHLSLKSGKQKIESYNEIISYKLQQHLRKFNYYSNKLEERNYEENFFMTIKGLILTKYFLKDIM